MYKPEENGFDPDAPESAASSETLSRRELLRRGGLLGAAGALGAGLASEDQATAQRVGATKMPTTILGKTGVRVSKLGFGGSWDIEDEVIGTGFELGINYIDTAESYRSGQSEKRFGEILKAKGATGHSAERKKLWLVTKTHSHRDMEARLTGCLNRLQQDYTDVYYMHGIGDPALPTDPAIKAAAERMKKSGKIRFFGFSCHDGRLVECLNAAADSNFIDVIMFKYNFRDYKADDMQRAIDRCAKAKIGLVAMKTQGGAMTLPDKFNVFKRAGVSQFQAAIKAVAADDRIHAIVSEMVTVEQVRQNADAISAKLTAVETDALRQYAQLTDHLWCRGCDHLCKPASGAGASLAIADTMRLLTYHDHYGKRDHARELFASLPAEERDLKRMEEGDWEAAEAACPYKVPLAKLMRRAQERLA